jgi:hypothetical protein
LYKNKRIEQKTNPQKNKALEKKGYICATGVALGVGSKLAGGSCQLQLQLER